MTNTFPIDLGKTSWDSTMKSSWTVTEQKSASGRRRALVTQLYPKWTFTCSFKQLSDGQVNTLLGFYNLCKGTFDSFYYKDYSRNSVVGQTLAQNTDGTYQCVTSLGGYVEPVSKVDNLTVYIDGVETTSYTETNGKITLSTSGTVTADYEYYFKVHFTADMTITQKFTNVNQVSITLETVR